MSSLTQRGSTLVQRHAAASARGAEGGKASNEADEDTYHEEEDDGESKETRLTLMEEVLLLGLKDREVRYNIYGGNSTISAHISHCFHNQLTS